MGPITLFDKSALQALSLNEAVLFDCLYRANICPIFFIETLADLEKEMKRGRTAEQVVGEIAAKTPICNSVPNVIHSDLCLNELLGYPVEMKRVPVMGGGRAVRRNGKVGIVYDQVPEMDAFQRWQDGKFFEVEREMARIWRAALEALDLATTARLLKGKQDKNAKPKTLEEVKALTERVVRGDGRRFLVLSTAFQVLQMPSEAWPFVLSRWKKMGGPPLAEFAPYAHHVFSVDVFFYAALAAGLISADRASNKIDMAYLYYLPFTMIFTSDDNLHARVAPLFLRDDQAFITGRDLKDDLRALDAHYSALPEAELQKGLYCMASPPPDDDRFLTSRLRARFLGRRRPTSPERRRAPVLQDQEVIRQIDELKAAARSRLTEDVTPMERQRPHQMVIERHIPMWRGKWRLLPQEVAAKKNRGDS